MKQFAHKLCAALSLIAALATGCQTAPEPRPIVKIDSDPPGARIYYGQGPNEADAHKTRSYIGITPLEWAIPVSGQGKFKIEGSLVYSAVVPPAAVFFAEPDHTQTNLFRPSPPLLRTFVPDFGTFRTCDF